MPRFDDNSVFSPSSKPRDKAAATTSAARAIVDAEASARKAKTERLRKLRLGKEAVEREGQPEQAPPRKSRSRRRS
jgi:hypothetical protein